MPENTLLPMVQLGQKQTLLSQEKKGQSQPLGARGRHWARILFRQVEQTYEWFWLAATICGKMSKQDLGLKCSAWKVFGSNDFGLVGLYNKIKLDLFGSKKIWV